MRRLAARAVIGAAWAGVLTLTGAYVRSDWRLQQPGRDLGAGAAIAGACWLLDWAAAELEAKPYTGEAAP